MPATPTPKPSEVTKVSVLYRFSPRYEIEMVGFTDADFRAAGRLSFTDGDLRLVTIKGDHAREIAFAYAHLERKEISGPEFERWVEPYVRLADEAADALALADMSKEDALRAIVNLLPTAPDETCESEHYGRYREIAALCKRAGIVR